MRKQVAGLLQIFIFTVLFQNCSPLILHTIMAIGIGVLGLMFAYVGIPAARQNK
jgi:hypothetical protein